MGHLKTSDLAISKIFSPWRTVNNATHKTIKTINIDKNSSFYVLKPQTKNKEYFVIQYYDDSIDLLLESCGFKRADGAIETLRALTYKQIMPLIAMRAL